MTTNQDIQLETDEGTGPIRNGRFVVYDDATGKPIVPGSIVKGHPTIGYGLALDVRGLSITEALFLLHNVEADFVGQLIDALPWTATLDTIRFSALLSMTYNLGINGLLGFHNMLSCLQRKDWLGAVNELQASRWWFQVGDRAKRIAAMFLTGKWQLPNQGPQNDNG